MKPKVLMNEKYRAKINALYSLKNSMHVFDKIAIEDIKYRLDINNPLQSYDFSWLDSRYRRYVC